VSASRKVTLTEIAQRVGVSAQTVSNAYNRPRKLSPALRERILATARELGYGGPDAAARSLRRGRAGAIGLILGEALPYAFDDPGAVQFLGGLATGCAAGGVGLQLVPAVGEPDDEARIRDAVVDGFVLWSLPDGDPLIRIVLERELAAVAIGSPLLDSVPFIGLDDRAAARAAAQHLLDRGHQRVGVIALPLTPTRRDGLISPRDIEVATQRVSRERMAGYVDALAAAQVDWSDIAAHEVAVNTREHGRRAARHILTATSPPTAILAMSDELALGALAAARAAGLKIPRDLAVIGWDDTRDSRLASPTLTTIHQDLREQGMRAADLLLSRAERAGRTSLHLAPWRLVIRHSS
jgi:DNA-binding LacI/PurR family transcriptional regulator